MLEKVLIGDRRYWGWIAILLVLIGIGVLAYLRQFSEGLSTTGLSRDVTWGFYIAQLTFLVGVAASAVITRQAPLGSRRRTLTRPSRRSLSRSVSLAM